MATVPNLTPRLTGESLTYCKDVKHYDTDRQTYPFITYMPETRSSDEQIGIDSIFFEDATALNKQSVDTLDYKAVRENVMQFHEAPPTNKFQKVTFKTIESLDCMFVEPLGNRSGERLTANGFIFYLHGGGFTTGSKEVEYLSRVARYTGCSLISVDYPLCPENSIGSAIEKVLKVYDYCIDKTRKNNKNINIHHNHGHNVIDINKDNKDQMYINELMSNWSNNNCVLMGNSAGGSLGLLLLQRLRDDKKALPRCVWLDSPWTDLIGNKTSECRKYNGKYDGIFEKGILLDLFNKQIIAGEMNGKLSTKNINTDDKDYQREILNKYSAINYKDFSGFENNCAMYFSVSANEILLDDTIIVAQNAYLQGVDVEVEINPFTVHSSIMISTKVPEAMAMVIRGCAWVVKHLQPHKKTNQFRSRL